MGRLTGLVLAVILLGTVGSAEAQVPATMGGFGFDYAQPISGNSYVLDRWWMVQATPSAGTALPPAASAEQSAAAEASQPGRVARNTRRGRSFSRVSTRPYNRYGVQPGAPLPTGSLYWPATAGRPLYAPNQRYVSYGQGYGVSPYGSADYGAQYKGMYWGH